jgi:hypothetical protein
MIETLEMVVRVVTIWAAAGMASAGLVALADRAVRRIQINALHRARRRMAHVRFMRRHREWMERHARP